MYKVFVYGTLMCGHINHYYLQDDQFIAMGDLIGYGLYNVDYYPGIIEMKDSKVRGEVYEISSKTLERLDDLEDEGSLYRRDLVNIILDDGSMIKAYTYIWNSSVKAEDYMDYKELPWRKGEDSV